MEEHFERLRKTSERILSIEPNARITCPFNHNPQEKTGQSTYERMDGYVNMWCPLSSAFVQEEQDARVARGDDSWWYVCCVPPKPRANLMVHYSGVAHRMLFWQQKQRGITGLLYWSAVFWEPKYTRDPWSNIRTYEFRGGAYGDGSLIYPGDEVGINGPVTSIRMELIRDGIEDYDYLTLFQQVRGEDALQALTARATTDLNTYTEDLALLSALRREAADAIDGKLKQPAK
ncbi:MAG: DUF4091 domain-containing protein [Proteobacteria bacterium]|nr:DUF4091 domain-containing protein [Pseudomonadota bacterium]